MKSMLHVTLIAAVPALAAVPAAAQDALDMPASMTDAASMLASQAADSLLVGDLLGAEVLGPSGDVAGTIANLVALPGGRIVAALVEPSGGGTPVPVPYSAVKVSRKADKLSAALPMPLDELQAMDEMQELAGAVKALPGD